MKLQTSDRRNQEGFVIVFVLMILVVVTILGLSSSRTSFVESKIVRNEQIYKDNFFDVDSGPYTIAKLVSRTVDEKREQDIAKFGFYLNVDGEISQTDVYRQLMGLEDYNNRNWEVGVGDARIDISEGDQNLVAGTATEFASGADGIGTGSKGGIEVNFTLSTTGKRMDAVDTGFDENDQERSVNIVGTYRKLPDIPGGL
jgi:hypothetical protein